MRCFAGRCLLLGLATLAQFACNRGSAPTTPRSSTVNELQPDADPEPTPAGPLLDELFLTTAEEVPGFAGIVIEAGEVVIKLVDTTQATAARSAVSRVFGDAPTVRGRPFRIAAARYSFTQLAGWRTALLESGTLSGVARMLDVDEGRNTVFIGVGDPTRVEVIRGSIRSLGIPDDAVQIQEIRSMRPLVDSLGNGVRPVVGGVLIGVWTGSGNPGYCSVGFKAKKTGSTRYFATNAHCTATFGALDGDSVGQPNKTKWIGSEHQDPGFTGTNCTSGYTCRWSDGALIKCDSISTCTLYTIAKTTSEYTGSNWTSGSGSLQLASDNWYVVGELGNTSLVQGASVSKVGFATGWTSGVIDQTCTDMLDWPATGKILKCQFTTLAVSRNGDSGSPIFQYETSTGKAWLGGVSWGILEVPYYVTVFSSIDGVKTDLGSLTVSSPVF